MKEMMAYALMTIGIRSKDLHQKSLKIAREVGDIHVDYGDTSCQSPNPLATLERKNF